MRERGGGERSVQIFDDPLMLVNGRAACPLLFFLINKPPPSKFVTLV